MNQKEGKTAEEIIKANIPNGIINIKGKGDGKPQYKAEIAVIKKCMEEYASQLAGSPGGTANGRYSWEKVGPTYYVWHKEGIVTTFIASTDNAEKAHFLAYAANFLSSGESPSGDQAGEAADYKAKYEKCIATIKKFDAGIIGMYDL